MKKEILKKIEELDNECLQAYSKVNNALEDNVTEYDSELCEYDFFNYYDGESNSHILDILDEQMYLIRKLKSFIEKLED